MENVLYDFCSLVDTYQKTHSFATLTRSFSDTTQLVNKNRTRAFSMKESLFITALFWLLKLFMAINHYKKQQSKYVLIFARLVLMFISSRKITFYVFND